MATQKAYSHVNMANEKLPAFMSPFLKASFPRSFLTNASAIFSWIVVAISCFVCVEVQRERERKRVRVREREEKEGQTGV